MSKFNQIEFLDGLHNAFKNRKKSYPKKILDIISDYDKKDADNIFAIDWE